MTSTPLPRALVPAVDRAARIFSVFEAEGRPLGVSDLARRIGDNKSSVYRVLETLRSHGLLERDEATKLYRLGARLARLGHLATEGQDLLALARPVLANLAEATGESVLLLVRAEDSAYILDKVESSAAAVRVSLPVGLRLPLAAGAFGTVFLAHVPPTQQRLHLAALPSFDERPVADEWWLRAQIAALRERGYAIDDELFLKGIRGVATGIATGDGGLAGVLLVTGLVSTLTPDRFADVGTRALAAAAQIRAALGGHPDGDVARAEAGARSD